MESVRTATRKALVVNLPKDLESVYKPIREELAQMEQALRRSLPEGFGTISESVAHVLDSEGKRVRPAIVLLAARACGLDGNSEAVQLAAAAELFHTATLVTDDILDAAAVRRGRRTVNYLWGMDAAVLTAQYLYLSALTVSSNISRNGDTSEYSGIMLGAASSMLSGEVKDIEAGKSPRLLSEQEYIDMIRDKTASLFSACSGMGALLADADSRVLGSMLAFGENLGIAFQIRDDVLDLVADEHLLGKSVGADFRMGKLTLPLIHHLRVSDRMGGRDLLERLAEREGGVERLRFSLEGSGSMDYSLGKARQYARTAERCLEVLGESAYKSSLVGLCRYAVEREM